MYHPTFNFYDDEIIVSNSDLDNRIKREINIISNSHDCLICWENNHVYKMQTFSIITNTCKCNGLFHRRCLFKWVYETNSCPICRSPSEFNIKLISRFLNKNKREQNINTFLEYETQRETKIQIALLITFNLIRLFMKFILYFSFYLFLFTFIIIGKNDVALLKP